MRIAATTSVRPDHSCAEDRITIPAAAVLFGLDPSALHRRLRDRTCRDATDFDLQKVAGEPGSLSRARVEQYAGQSSDAGPGHLNLPASPRARGRRPRRAWVGALTPISFATSPNAADTDASPTQLSLNLR